MADANYVPQVDYTSKDYTSIKADIVDLIPSYVPAWTNRDPSDFGMALIELFAYMGDSLNYYIDRSANEAFLLTATQRDSVLQMSRILGYSATLSTAATVTLTFYNSTASIIVVPAGTRVATSASTSASQIIFETDYVISVPAKVGAINGSYAVTATQGYSVTSEVIGTSNGEINQVWKLAKSPLIQDSVSVVVGSLNYTQVPYLIDYNNYDPVFSIYTNAAKESYVLFGDNVSGRIPNLSAVIYATYRVGGGASGNVAAETLNSIITNPVAGLTVTNLAAADGGADEESTDSIRVNAPLSLKSLNRAVSLSDYSSLAKAAGVAKANAIADVYSSVTIYFAPYGDKGVEIDGVTPSTIFNTKKVTVNDYLVGKVPANTTVTYQPPSYVPVDLTVEVTVLAQYRRSLVTTAVNTAIKSLFAFDNVSFQDRITLQDIMSVIKSVNGVAYVQVNKLVRNDADLTYVVTNKAASGTVATLTIGTHGLTVGSRVSVGGVDSTFNGVFTVTAVASTTFSYALLSAVVSSTAATGSATKYIVDDIVCGVNEIPEINSTALAIAVTGGINN